LEANAPTFSLDRPFDEAGELTLSDVLEQMTIPSAEENVMATFLKDKLNLSLEGLTVMEEKILRLRFGLDDDTPLTLREIGLMLNLSRERIRQIEAQALRKLRESLRESSLSSYLN
jgi:RNA polymerase primary sigma factor